MAKRRGNHEGTIYQQPNGSWRAHISIAGRRLSKVLPTQRDCREWLKEMRAKLDDGLTLAGARVTVKGHLATWLDSARPTLRPNTIVQYERIVKRYLDPALGRLRLEDLRPDHVQRLYATAQSSGTGVRTVRLIHSVLHRALHQALKWGLVRRNVCDAVDPPIARRTEMTALSARQVDALLSIAESHRLYGLFYLALSTGLREGELLGLRWTDVDWTAGALQVQRQAQWLAGQGVVFQEPKTARGRRAVPLGSATLAVLRDHRKRQVEERLFYGAAWVDQDLLFTTTRGTPLNPSNLIKAFRALLDAAGLPAIRFHDLRHTAATLMLAQGVNPKIVQERLGHASITLTLDTYSHVLPTMQREAADLIDAILDRNRARG
jgi:integrase